MPDKHLLDAIMSMRRRNAGRAPGSFLFSMLGGLAWSVLLCIFLSWGDSVGAAKFSILMMPPLVLIVFVVAIVLAVFAYWAIVYIAHLMFPVRPSRSAVPFFLAVIGLGALWGAAIEVLFNPPARLWGFLFFGALVTTLGIAAAVPFWFRNRDYSPVASGLSDEPLPGNDVVGRS